MLCGLGCPVPLCDKTLSLGIAAADFLLIMAAVIVATLMSCTSIAVLFASQLNPSQVEV